MDLDEGYLRESEFYFPHEKGKAERIDFANWFSQFFLVVSPTLKNKSDDAVNNLKHCVNMPKEGMAVIPGLWQLFYIGYFFIVRWKWVFSEMNQNHTSQRLYVTCFSHLVNTFFQKWGTSSLSYGHTTQWYQ